MWYQGCFLRNESVFHLLPVRVSQKFVLGEFGFLIQNAFLEPTWLSRACSGPKTGELAWSPSQWQVWNLKSTADTECLGDTEPGRCLSADSLEDSMCGNISLCRPIMCFSEGSLLQSTWPRLVSRCHTALGVRMV